MNCKSLLFFFEIFFLVNNVKSYRPVLLIPGIADPFLLQYKQICDCIKQEHPGTECVHIQPGTFALGWTSMWGQVDWYRNAMLPYFNTTNYPDGVNIVAHSQGTLISRAVIMTTSNHTVRNLYNLASPALGLYGLPGVNPLLQIDLTTALLQFLNITLPPIPKFLEPLILGSLTNLFYTPALQNSFSWAAYWHDPTDEARFLKENTFLPLINNLIPHANFDLYKTNFLKLNSTTFIAAELDNVVYPWQSACFGYYGPNKNIIPIGQQKVYVEDTFGLKTLNDTGRLTLMSLPVGHVDFVFNLTLIKTYVVPRLN